MAGTVQRPVELADPSSEFIELIHERGGVDVDSVPITSMRELAEGTDLFVAGEVVSAEIAPTDPFVIHPQQGEMPNGPDLVQAGINLRVAVSQRGGRAAEFVASDEVNVFVPVWTGQASQLSGAEDQVARALEAAPVRSRILVASHSSAVRSDKAIYAPGSGVFLQGPDDAYATYSDSSDTAAFAGSDLAALVIQASDAFA